MDRYIIEIRKEGQYVAVECSGNTPCLLADDIRDLVEKYFGEGDEKR